jgi:DNA-directed RNA polymerase sigma subunit (sigma70/sigma32)
MTAARSGGLAHAQSGAVREHQDGPHGDRGDPNAVDPEAALLALERESSVRLAVAGLPPRERSAVLARSSGATLHQAGRVLGVSRERVRQLAVKGMARLRQRVSGELWLG